MENETRNSRVRNMTDSVSGTESASSRVRNTSAEGSTAPRSARVASGMRSQSAGPSRVRTVDLSDVTTSTRSTSAARTPAARTASGDRPSTTSRSSSSRTTTSARTSSRTSAGSRTVSEVTRVSADRPTSSSRPSSAARVSQNSSGQKRTTAPNRKYSDIMEEKRTSANRPVSSRSSSSKSSSSRLSSSKKKKGSKKKGAGFKKFLIVYSAIWVVLIILTAIILSSFLKSYEKGLASTVAAEVAEEFKSTSKLEAYLEKNSKLVQAGETVLGYEDSYMSYIDGKEITYVQDNSNSTTETTVYKVLADGSPVALLYMTKTGSGGFGLKTWELSAIDTSVAFTDITTYSILVPEGSTVAVNGTTLEESSITGTGIPSVLEGTVDFLSDPPEFTTYEFKLVSGTPEITGTDADGTDLVFQESGNSFVAGGAASQEFIDEVSDRVESGLKEWALYFIYQSFGLEDYILDDCEWHAYIFGSDEMDPINPWLYNWEYIEDYEFSEFDVKNYIKYSDDCFAVDVKYHLDITFTDSKYNDDNQEIDATWVWIKDTDGVWRIADNIYINE